MEHINKDIMKSVHSESIGCLKRLKQWCYSKMRSNPDCLLCLFTCSFIYVMFFVMFVALILRTQNIGKYQAVQQTRGKFFSLRGSKATSEPEPNASNIKLSDADVVEDSEFVDYDDPLTNLTDTSLHKAVSSEDFQFPMNIDMPTLVNEILHNRTVSTAPINNMFIPWIVEHNMTCHDNIYTVILIKTHFKNALNREMIRSTWGMHSCWKQPVLIYFLMGSHSPYIIKYSNGVKKLAFRDNSEVILKESRIFNDIILGKYSDHYYNNTLKFMTGINWVKKNCRTVKFVNFVDDDYFVHPYQVMRYLMSVSSTIYPKFIGGYVWRYSTPRRRAKKSKSKWDISMVEYPWRSYPPYIAAGFILMSKPVLDRISIAMQYTRYLRFDDVFLGLVMHKLLLVPLHISTVHSYQPITPSSNNWDILYRIIASHGFKQHTDLHLLWTRLKMNQICSSSYGYEYNKFAKQVVV